MTYEDIARHLVDCGQKEMAVMVRQQTMQLRHCREESLRTLKALYELRDKHSPPVHHVHEGYRSPPESDG